MYAPVVYILFFEGDNQLHQKEEAKQNWHLHNNTEQIENILSFFPQLPAGLIYNCGFILNMKLPGSIKVATLWWPVGCLIRMSSSVWLYLYYVISLLYEPITVRIKAHKTPPLLTSWSNNTQTFNWSSNPLQNNLLSLHQSYSACCTNWFGRICMFVKITAIDFHDYMLIGWSFPPWFRAGKAIITVLHALV